MRRARSRIREAQGDDYELDYYVHDDPGGRPYMEDRHIAYDYVNIALGLPVFSRQASST